MKKPEVIPLEYQIPGENPMSFFNQRWTDRMSERNPMQGDMRGAHGGSFDFSRNPSQPYQGGQGFFGNFQIPMGGNGMRGLFGQPQAPEMKMQQPLVQDVMQPQQGSLFNMGGGSSFRRGWSPLTQSFY